MQSNFNYHQHNYQPTEKIESDDGKPFVIPDGVYSGKWSGYVVEAEILGRKYTITTKFGVRGFNIPVHVVVDGGEVWIK